MPSLHHHPILFLLLFTIPLAGWLFFKISSKRTVIIGGLISLLMLLPVLTGYSYAIESAYGFFVYFLLVFGWAYFHKITEQEETDQSFVPTAWLSAGLLFVGLFFSFLDGFFGTDIVEKEWRVKRYKVSYVADNNFVHQVYYYRLSKYSMGNLFVKELERKWDNDSVPSNWVRFNEAGFNFNKRNPDSSYLISEK